MDAGREGQSPTALTVPQSLSRAIALYRYGCVWEACSFSNVYATLPTSQTIVSAYRSFEQARSRNGLLGSNTLLKFSSGREGSYSLESLHSLLLLHSLLKPSLEMFLRFRDAYASGSSYRLPSQADSYRLEYSKVRTQKF